MVCKLAMLHISGEKQAQGPRLLSPWLFMGKVKLSENIMQLCRRSRIHYRCSCEEQQQSHSLSTVSSPGILKKLFYPRAFCTRVSVCVCDPRGFHVSVALHTITLLLEVDAAARPSSSPASGHGSDSHSSLQGSSLRLWLFPPKKGLLC